MVSNHKRSKRLIRQDFGHFLKDTSIFIGIFKNTTVVIVFQIGIKTTDGLIGIDNIVDVFKNNQCQEFIGKYYK